MGLLVYNNYKLVKQKMCIGTKKSEDGEFSSGNNTHSLGPLVA